MVVPLNFNFEHSEKQAEVISAFNDNDISFIGYGGARKGGKSFIARAMMVFRRLLFPGTLGLIVREHQEDVDTNHRDQIKQLLIEVGLKEGRDWSYVIKGSVFTFHGFTRAGIPSRLILGHLDGVESLKAYQGNPYLDIFIEEGTQINGELVELLCGSLANEHYPATVPKMITTCNPGGAYDKWVKEWFVNAHTRMPATLWVQSLPSDNPFFMKSDPGFIERMRRLYRNKPWIIAQWLEGSWTANPDRFFNFDEKYIKTDEEVGLQKAYWKQTIAGVDYGAFPSAFGVLYAHRWQDYQGKPRLHVSHEIHEYRMNADEQAIHSLQFEAMHDLYVRRRWADPATDHELPSTAKTVDKTIRKIWSRQGWVCRPSQKMLKATSLQVVNMLFDRGIVSVSPNCPAFIAELTDTNYKKSAGGGITGVTDPNQDDDMVDSFRFMVAKEYRNYFASRPKSGWEAISLEEQEKTRNFTLRVA